MYVRTNSTLIVCVAGFLMTCLRVFVQSATACFRGRRGCVFCLTRRANAPNRSGFCRRSMDSGYLRPARRRIRNSRPQEPHRLPRLQAAPHKAAPVHRAPRNSQLHRKPSARRPRNKFESRNISAWRESCLRSTSPTLAIKPSLSVPLRSSSCNSEPPSTLTPLRSRRLLRALVRPTMTIPPPAGAPEDTENASPSLTAITSSATRLAMLFCLPFFTRTRATIASATVPPCAAPSIPLPLPGSANTTTPANGSPTTPTSWAT